MASNKLDRLTTEQIALTSKYLAEMTERFASPIAAIQAAIWQAFALLHSLRLFHCWDTLTRGGCLGCGRDPEPSGPGKF